MNKVAFSMQRRNYSRGFY